MQVATLHIKRKHLNADWGLALFVNHWIRWYNVNRSKSVQHGECCLLLFSKIHKFPFCPHHCSNYSIVICSTTLFWYLGCFCCSLGLHSFLILMHASWQQGYVATFNRFIEKLVYLDICWSSVLDQGPHELSRRLFLEPWFLFADNIIC